MNRAPARSTWATSVATVSRGRRQGTIPWSPRPPARSFESYSVTPIPALRSSAAQARPAGPAPMIAALTPASSPGVKKALPAAAYVSTA